MKKHYLSVAVLALAFSANAQIPGISDPGTYNLQCNCRQLVAGGGAGPDVTLPTQSGVVIVSSIGTTTAALAWSAAADNLAVTGYEYRLNGTGSWTAVGNVLTTNLTGLTPGNPYTVEARAFDAAGNRSMPAVTGSFSTNSSGGTDITLAAACARNSGVAPLAVHVNAIGSTATSATVPSRDIHYEWDFGDPAGGETWAYGARPGVSSRNEATGITAAHLYKTPGTYLAKVRGKNGTGTTAQTTACTITVTDPDTVFAANTVCIAAGTTPVAGSGGCPSGAAVLNNADFDAGLTAQLAAGKKRILFKRGDTFARSSSVTVATSGAGIIGAYGSGAKPIISATTSSEFFVLSNSTNKLSDWRFMDLELDGNSNAGTAINPNWHVNKLTFTGIDFHDIGSGFIFPDAELNALNSGQACTGPFPYTGTCDDPLFDQVAIIDNTLVNAMGGGGDNGLFMSVIRLMVMGNSLDTQAGAEHVMRSQFTAHGVITNNYFANPASGKHTLTIRGLDWTGSNSIPAGQYNEYITITDNKMQGNAVTAQLVTMTPQNDSSDERRRYITFERNWLVSGGTTSVMHLVEGANGDVFRNNIFDMGTTTPNGLTMSDITASGTPSTNVHALNNTFVRQNAGTTRGIQNSSSGTTGFVARNNIVYNSACSGTCTVIGGTWTQSNNSASVTTNPNFVGPLSSPAGFKPTSGFAVGGGTAVPVYEDFFGVVTPGTPDIGAVVH